ncbi:MAG TPA: MBL fold metallo-hydrolase [Gemmatimonadaceae bacterium]|nr:MBL fold metallo-hydrolase [Gemmatimonadaceae bacterium]
MSIPQPLVSTMTLGAWTVHAIQAGGQALDGGAMFGVVPKPLWERRIPADARNRIPLGMRCLLIEHDVGLVLIDNGAGNKDTAKFLDIYGIENAGADGRTLLEDGLRSLGHRPEDVTLMIDTHLHFDHAGGNTFRDADGRIAPAFPRARYVVQRGEYAWATQTNERTAASYFPSNFEPVREAGLLDLVEGDREIVPGISVIHTPGHTPYHQSVRIESKGEVAFYLGDLVPTAAHLPLPWIMGYDVEPLVTLETKRKYLRRAAEEHWLLIFEHDASVAWGRIVREGKSYGLESGSGAKGQGPGGG